MKPHGDGEMQTPFVGGVAENLLNKGPVCVRERGSGSWRWAAPAGVLACLAVMKTRRVGWSGTTAGSGHGCIGATLFEVGAA